MKIVTIKGESYKVRENQSRTQHSLSFSVYLTFGDGTKTYPLVGGEELIIHIPDKDKVYRMFYKDNEEGEHLPLIYRRQWVEVE